MPNKSTLKIIAVLVALFGIWLYGNYQYKTGYKDMEMVMQLEIAKQNEQARKKEHQLQQAVDALDRQRTEERINAEKTIASLKRDVAAGNKRLRVKVDSASICTSQTTKSPSVANGTTSAYLDGGVATDIIGLIARGDAAIIQLNGLQDWVEEVTK